MGERRAETVTRLLGEWRDGDPAAIERLLPHVYDELRRIAARQMRDQRAGHTLQSTAVVHEAYLRLVQAGAGFEDRGHFFAVAARAMRQILVDHARTKNRDKRGGGGVKLTLDEAAIVSEEPPAELLDLDRALDRLIAQDERKGRVVELHFFGGLNYESIAEALGVSLSTVRADMRFARAWLLRELTRAPDSG